MGASELGRQGIKLQCHESSDGAAAAHNGPRTACPMSGSAGITRSFGLWDWSIGASSGEGSREGRTCSAFYGGDILHDKIGKTASSRERLSPMKFRARRAGVKLQYFLSRYSVV